PDELRGVLAHELAHVRNRDILIGSVAAAIAMGITFIARIVSFGAFFGAAATTTRVVGTLSASSPSPSSLPWPRSSSRWRYRARAS
ncbi:MAG TPA: M48 family metalloprotease, partial [Actinomycetota bacterium]|nr:M48 family metalloprotease [Actinomycetota bacterium]